jgi:hypothetical protein
MSTPNLTSSFISYILSPDETSIGSVLTTLQKQCIQNQICSLAEQKLALKYSPDSPMVFLQQEAELQGQLSALRYLIILSENAEASLLQSAS